MPVPYVIVAETLAHSKDHKSKKIMQGYWHALQKTAQLWLKSSSRLKILQMADEMALRLKPITKIVCFGLGAITHEKAFYESSLQHMTAFSIAERLKKAYRDKYNHESPVEIILQDPCYTQKDYELLNKMYSGGPLTFVSDPDGILEINANTIVLTALLPVTYPLMQIITDLFHGKEGEGPAAIICDSMDLDPAQQLYALVDRASPEVARFLTNEYSVSDFKDHVLEPELAEDVSGGEGASRPYWLSKMQLYMRRDR